MYRFVGGVSPEADEEIEGDFQKFDDRQNAKAEIKAGLAADVADKIGEVIRN